MEAVLNKISLDGRLKSRENHIFYVFSGCLTIYPLALTPFLMLWGLTEEIQIFVLNKNECNGHKICDGKILYGF